MIFFTSDTHFDHFNMTEEGLDLCKRGFRNTEHMNQTLINNWKRVVSDDDIVWFLGDVAMGKIADSLPLISQLPGTKALVYGNHDRVFDPKKREEWKQKYHDVGFVEVVEMATIELPLTNPTMALMSHFPYSGDHTEEDRYAEHRPTDNGMWLLHGHVHDAWKRNGRMINVGVDVWDFTPVSMTQIVEIIEAEREGRI